MIILSTLLTIALARLMAKYDSKKILDEDYILKKGHAIRVALRFVIIVAITFVALPETYIDYLFILLINFSVFWIGFDVLINSDLQLPLFRIGETAWTDRQLNKISNGSEELAFIFKYLIFFLFVFGYIEYLNYFA